MKNIILTTGLISFLFIPQISNAVLLLSACSTQESQESCQKRNQELNKLQEQIAEENKIQQEKLIAEQKAEKQQQEKLINQEEIEKVNKENESQAKIKELEDRIKSLESQKQTITTPSANEKNSTIVYPTNTINQKLQTPIKQEKPLENDRNTPNAVISPTIENVTQKPQKKINLFRRIISWFKGK